MLNPCNNLKHRHRHAKQRQIYYKSECLACDFIISIQWERPYIGVLPIYRDTQKNICPKCQGSHIKRVEIRKQEYLDIGRHWDLLNIAD
ncbi:MAG: hypothetical protein KAH77_01185 [Thiomargarita sp.]|nr:hypothetical protein [Thiomargarita sp.]